MRKHILAICEQNRCRSAPKTGFLMTRLNYVLHITSKSTIFQSCRDGATASWVINQYFRGVKCFAQGHNTVVVGFEPPTSRSGVRHSTTEPPRSPKCRYEYAYEGFNNFRKHTKNKARFLNCRV